MRCGVRAYPAIPPNKIKLKKVDGYGWICQKCKREVKSDSLLKEGNKDDGKTF